MDMDFLAMKARYALLGRDFLTWLYLRSERTHGVLPELGDGTELFFDDSLVLVADGERPAASSLRGVPASMRAEVAAALRSGKKIAKARLQIVRPAGDFALALDTDTWTLKGLKVSSGAAAGGDDEAVILERLALLEQAEELLERLFSAYLDVRTDQSRYAAFGDDLVAWATAA